MDIRELKELLKNSTSVLVLDNGEPSYVIVDYAVYRKITGQRGEEVPVNHRNGPALPAEAAGVRHQLSPQEVQALERLNQEIQTLKEQIEREEGEVAVAPEVETDLENGREVSLDGLEDHA